MSKSYQFHFESIFHATDFDEWSRAVEALVADDKFITESEFQDLWAIAEDVYDRFIAA